MLRKFSAMGGGEIPHIPPVRKTRQQQRFVLNIIKLSWLVIHTETNSPIRVVTFAEKNSDHNNLLF